MKDREKSSAQPATPRSSIRPGHQSGSPEAIWQSKDRLIKVTRGANDGMWDWDLARNKLHYSSRWFEMLGYEAGEFTHSPELWRVLMHPEDAAATEAVLGRALSDGSETYEVEFRLRHKSGRYVPVLSRGFITRGRNHKPVRVSGANSDLTLQKAHELQLRKTSAKLAKSEQKFRTFFEQSPIPLCHLEITKDGSSNKLLLINQAFHDLFGYTHEEIPTMEKWVTNAYPDLAYRRKALKQWEKDVAAAMATKGHVQGREYHVRCKGEIDVSVLIGGIFIEGSLLVTFMDLTSQKNAERELRERERELRVILENVPIPISYAIQQEKTRIRFINLEFKKCFGYTLRDIPTIERWFELAYPDAKYREASKRKWHDAMETALATNGVIKPLEFRITCKDGKVRDVMISSVSLGDMIVGSLLDVTESKRAEVKLRQAAVREKLLKKKQLLTLQKKLQTSVVAAAVAHEINQPLSEILLKSRLVLHELQGGGNGVPGGALPMILQGIVSDSQRIKQTIEKMRALLRNVPTTLIPINLRDVIDGSILYLKPRIKKETVKIHILEEAHLPSVAGDTQQLQLALSNLMRNALDALAFSPPENRVIRIEIKRSGGGIELTIEDSGPGIAPHLRAEIFEILTSSKPKGTGIGLYLARTAMTNHGGSIHHGESPLGGAQFQLRFPVHSKRRTRVAPQKS